ncbi:MAG TPA: NAD(P)H-binding protein [Burkholderiales bacterium]|nr:NAD(P)H-binding protein [Burkholderiales bacterium]
MLTGHQRIFVAGASGAIGLRLCRLLVADGWQVTGTTRRPERAKALREIGVEPEIVDVYDAAALLRAVVRAQPSVVIHQLTDLPPGLDPTKMEEGRARNARIRDVGTRHLVAAAVEAGARRIVAQSIAFAYAPGPAPYQEDAPLASEGLAAFERQVLNSSLEALVLRYGQLYGPGTGFDTAPKGAPVHVDAAADAARRAVTRGKPGIYNVAEDDGTVSSAKAIEQFGWYAGFRIPGERG